MWDFSKPNICYNIGNLKYYYKSSFVIVNPAIAAPKTKIATGMALMISIIAKNHQ